VIVIIEYDCTCVLSIFHLKIAVLSTFRALGHEINKNVPSAALKHFHSLSKELKLEFFRKQKSSGDTLSITPLECHVLFEWPLLKSLSLSIDRSCTEIIFLTFCLTQACQTQTTSRAAKATKTAKEVAELRQSPDWATFY